MSVAAGGLYLAVGIPWSDIRRLRTGYVEVASAVEGGRTGVTYRIVAHAPTNWVPLAAISPVAVQAVIVSEDIRFFVHGAVDGIEIRRALRNRWRGNKPLRGASTISQQTVKNLFVGGRRSFWRKARELVCAVYLERHVDKRKILEIYLNIIETGERLNGIGGAATCYFETTPAALTARQGAFLAMLLPNPPRLAESYRQRRLTGSARRKIRIIFVKMRDQGYLTSEQYAAARSERFAWETVEGPGGAP